MYRQDGYETFEHYCKERWGWNRTYVFYVIGSAQAANDVFTIVNTDGVALLPPSNESQARELSRLPTPEARRNAWAAVREEKGDAITAADVREYIRSRKTSHR